MSSFTYSAIDSNGADISGTLEAQDKRHVLEILKEKQLFPFKIREITKNKGTGALFMQKTGLKDITIFCRQFYTMLNAGVSIIKCLDILQIQTQNKRLKEASRQIYEAVQKGKNLSEAMKEQGGVFPELLVNMVEAGEISGTLDSIMERLAGHFEKENKIRNKIKAAMIYPVILSILAVSVVFFLLTFVMPTFFGMFEKSGVELPLPTKLLVMFSDFMLSYWYIIILSAALLIYIIRRYLKTDGGRYKWDRLKLKMPVLKKVVTNITTARFTRTLSTLLGSGISLLQALEITSKVVNNRVAAKGLLSVREDMKKGMDLSTPVKKIGIFPPMVNSMLSIGEESGMLEDILEKSAEFYDEEVESSMQKLVSVMEPLLIVIMAFVIGFIVVAMALPMFDIFNTVK